jgi:hypothetical protein
MAKPNPFSTNGYDLGIGDTYGHNIDTVNDNILRTAYSQEHTCCICKYEHNTPVVRVVAKYPQYNTAEVQNGLYLCNHCISLQAFTPAHYALQRLGE